MQLLSTAAAGSFITPLCDTYVTKEVSLLRHVGCTTGIADNAAHRALALPEILLAIVQFLDDSNNIPHEPPPLRRKPLSLRHARLIYRTEEKARQVWEAVMQEETPDPATVVGSGVHSCLLVNRAFFAAATVIINTRIHFQSYRRWQQFVAKANDKNNVVQRHCNAKTFVLHKLGDATQEELDSVNISGNLEWLELYTCSSVVPKRELLAGKQMRRLILPGCLLVDDNFLEDVARLCPRLRILDLRACDRVTDRGISAIAKGCPRLSMLNVGRTTNGHRITSQSIEDIARETQVDTLGLAGTCISDEAIWAIATHRGSGIERLSLNNCILLTNASIPFILQHTPNLTVLELRGCLQITKVRPIVEFKLAQERQHRALLLEGCEVFELRMREEEYKIAVEAWYRSRDDIREWLEGDYDDEDLTMT